MWCGLRGGSIPVDFATVERVYVALEIDASVLVPAMWLGVVR